MNDLLDSDRQRETGKIMDKAIRVALGPFFPKSARSLPRHEVDRVDGMDVEYEWQEGMHPGDPECALIRRVFLLFNGQEYDITDAVRTNRDGSLTTIVEELFEEVAELNRADEEEHDMSESPERQVG